MRALRDIEALPLQRRDRIRRLFRWLICSPTAPLLKDIMETVVIDDMGDEWDPSRCIARPSSLIEDCANLVVATSLVSDTNSSHSGEETSADQMLTSTVQFIHASVREFLLSESSSPEEAPLPAYHYYPLSAAHLPLVLTGFKYYEVSNTLKLRERRDSHMTEAWYTHLRLAGDDGRHLISQFRQFLNPASSTRIKWVEAYNE
ncbi:hypothetical protein FA95DRAFT_317375 [Auriscalpium vulgare]|uniref:Uncharacterized protein n=1 Tax=Auriscalpium vulgare TaxID=40419 RepID=A0ACB8S5G2_9AGAM|nr:hypothetical protein FA95DRAFT_317375 [Auriscalpium vulgare]